MHPITETLWTQKFKEKGVYENGETNLVRQQCWKLDRLVTKPKTCPWSDCSISELHVPFHVRHPYWFNIIVWIAISSIPPALKPQFWLRENIRMFICFMQGGLLEKSKHTLCSNINQFQQVLSSLKQLWFEQNIRIHYACVAGFISM